MTGDRIRKRRLELGMKQKDVAQALGLQAQSVEQWENNRRKPKFETLERIAQALKTSPDRLMDPDDLQRLRSIVREDEYTLLDHYRNLSAAGKKMVVEYARLLRFGTVYGANPDEFMPNLPGQHKSSQEEHKITTEDA